MKKNIIFLLVVLFINNCYTQTIIDSLKLIWENSKNEDSIRFKAIFKYYKTQTYAAPDSVLPITDFHYNLAKTKNSKAEMAVALNEKSYAYYLKGDTKKSMHELNKVIELYKQLNDSLNLATIYGNLGSIYGGQSNYLEAVRYFNMTLTIFQKKGIKKGEARMLSNLGLIYYYLDNDDLALKNFREGINIYEKLGRIDKTGSILSSIGSVYLRQEKYQDAIHIGESALKISLDNNDKVNASNCYFLIANAYQKLNNKDKTIYYLDKSIEIENAIQNNSKIIDRLTFKASLKLDSDLKSATKIAEEVLKLVNDDTANELKANLYNLLYKCYKAQNKLDLSLAMHEKYATYNDSLQIEKNNFAIIENAIQKEYKEKLNETKLENTKSQAALQLNHLKKIYGITTISILLITLITLLARKSILTNRKKREKLLKELERLKNIESSNIAAHSNKFELDRVQIEKSIKQKLNETDWTVLNILLEDPVIANKGISEKAFMSIDGIGSCLRRMYVAFDIKESKYKKISLLMDAIKRSKD